MQKYIITFEGESPETIPISGTMTTWNTGHTDYQAKTLAQANE